MRLPCFIFSALMLIGCGTAQKAELCYQGVKYYKGKNYVPTKDGKDACQLSKSTPSYRSCEDVENFQGVCGYYVAEDSLNPGCYAVSGYCYHSTEKCLPGKVCLHQHQETCSTRAAASLYAEHDARDSGVRRFDVIRNRCCFGYRCNYEARKAPKEHYTTTTPLTAKAVKEGDVSGGGPIITVIMAMVIVGSAGVVAVVFAIIRARQAARARQYRQQQRQQQRQHHEQQQQEQKYTPAVATAVPAMRMRPVLATPANMPMQPGVATAAAMPMQPVVATAATMPTAYPTAAASPMPPVVATAAAAQSTPLAIPVKVTSPKFCPECGVKTNSDQQKFCAECGYNLSAF